MSAAGLSAEWTKQTGRIWANLRRVDPNPIIVRKLGAKPVFRYAKERQRV